MKVLFLASYFPKPENPVMGTWALAQAQALVRQGIEVEVVSFTSWVPKSLAITPGAKAYASCPQTYTWSGGVRVHYPRWVYYPVRPLKQAAYRRPVPYLQVARWSAQPQLMRLIDQYQPDLIFCHHTLPNGWLAAQLPPSHQRPLVVLDHDFDEITDGHIYPNRYRAMQTVAQQAYAMLAVSNRMAQSLRQLFPTTRVSTHHNGIDLLPEAMFHQPRPVELNPRKVVLSCALFAERKGMPLLIEAFSRVAAKHPDAILRIIGTGPEADKVEQTIARLNLADQVQLLGRRPHAEVLQEMAWADAFALVGWDEPFATVYLESMAAGNPIVCCHDGGITDVMQDGVHGYVVPPKDMGAVAIALDKLLSQDDARRRMGKNARHLIEQNLTWDIQAQSLIALFEQALMAN